MGYVAHAIRRPGAILPVLVGLFAFAWTLRLIGVDWHGVHPDEGTGISARMLTGQLTGYPLYYPPLLNYLVAIAYVGLYALGRLLGWWQSAGDFRDLYFTDRTMFFLVARAVAAACSACGPPLLFLVARALGAGRGWALAGGLAAALIPGEIFWSHIEKSDVALASAYLFAALAVFRLLDRPERLGRRLLLGFALALAVSFKQSAIFFLAPFVAMAATESLRDAPRRAAMLAGWAVAVVAAAIAWAPLNLGILLDFDGFLAAQKVQTQMSVRHAGLGTTLAAGWGAMRSGEGGMSPVLLLLSPVGIVGAYLLAPDRTAARRYAMLAVATFVGLAVIAAIARDRQPPNLLLPFATMIQFLLLIGAGLIAHDPGRRPIAAAVIVLVAAAAVVRLVPMYRQFAAEPIARRAAESVVRLVPPRARLLSAIPIPDLRQSDVGAEEMRERDRRLAARYGLALTPSVTPPSGDPDGYVVRYFPVAIGGMEFTPEDAKVLIPYAWPIQHAEWRLRYWTERGYRHFLIDPWFLTPRGVPAYTDFFTTIARDCRLLDRIRTERPLLWERDLALYRCG